MLSAFKRNSSISQSRSSSALSPAAVLNPTSRRAITPVNPGSHKTHQFIETITKSRPYTEVEAIHLEGLAQRAEGMAKSTERAFGAAQKISNAQVKIHHAYEGYRQNEAKNEFSIVESKAKTAATLETLRPGYHKLAQGLDRVHITVETEIGESIKMFG